jgi:signal transduction histidine kinase
MTDSALSHDELLELALHARVLQRCRRALLHEVRNGLQPMHAGLEALSRITAVNPFPLEKAQRYIQLVRQASSSQEQALERAVERIAPDNIQHQTVDLAGLVREVARYLSSDAAVAGVRLQVDVPASLMVSARPHHLRLILLACTLDAIDHAGASGQLTITGQPMDPLVLLQFIDTRTLAPEFKAQSAGEQPTTDQLHLYVARRLLAPIGGELDCVAGEGTGYTVALTVPAAEMSAASP